MSKRKASKAKLFSFKPVDITVDVNDYGVLKREDFSLDDVPPLPTVPETPSDEKER